MLQINVSSTSPWGQNLQFFLMTSAAALEEAKLLRTVVSDADTYVIIPPQALQPPQRMKSTSNLN